LRQAKHCPAALRVMAAILASQQPRPDPDPGAAITHLLRQL
jgi:hypothetical protein